ncbi:MAG TPA: hypothetical protein VFZ36_11065 [Vicinamibacterales bacterium]
MRWLLRFFRAADGMPVWMVALTAAIGLYAAAVSILDPTAVDEALAMLLLWQMLCASAGFAHPAAAGHFDPALVRCDRRLVALAHAVHAAWPVAALWLLIAAIDAAHRQAVPLAFEPGRFAAFLFVSAACWAGGLRAPRLTVGALWLVAIVAVATTRFGAGQYAAMLARPDGTPLELLHAAALALACPFLMVGDHVPPRMGAAAVLAVAAAVSAAAGVMHISGRSYPLEPAS